MAWPSCAPRRASPRLGGAIAALAGVVVAVLALAAPAPAAPRECFLLDGLHVGRRPVGRGPGGGLADRPGRRHRRSAPTARTAACSCPWGATTSAPAARRRRRTSRATCRAPGIGLINGANAFFFAINRSATAASFRPRIGCVPQPGGAAAAAGPERRHAGADARAGAAPVAHGQGDSHRCRRGERLVRGTAGVLFHRDRPPTARELRDVDVTPPPRQDPRARAGAHGRHGRATASA